ncbi:MAG TPA: exopolysaccharide biosynthesis polyprenyl glycosylphosphotransferase [Thermoanaerobaculia bacterium]|jgi:exopolysaccharide biosynthesis polyprenyl glycosylphosphotransferase
MRPRGRFAGRTALLASGDVSVAAALFAVIVAVRRVLPLPGTQGTLPAPNVPLDAPWLAGVALVTLSALWLAGTYDEPLASLKERGGLLVAALLAGGLLVALYFLAGRSVPRTVLLLWVPLLSVSLGLWRRAADAVAPIGMRPVLVLGAGEDARRAADALASGRITGHTLLEWREDPSAWTPGPARDVLFASDKPEDRRTLVTLLERSLEHDFDLWILPGVADVVASRVVTRSLGDLPLVPVVTRGASAFAFAWRRALDLVLGTALTLLALPVLLVVTAAVALESPGAPWIRQRRVGRGGGTFQLWKVRTMRRDAEARTGPTLSVPDDERVTRVGGLLRRSRLDELPQLLHVVGGSMSLIGPRPERPEFVETFAAQVPAYRLRHVLKPGLTGLAQVMGAYATQPDVKLRYDLGYLFHWTPALDLFVLLRTVVTVLRGSGV